MIDGKTYGLSRALCNQSPLLAPLDVSIAALQEGLSLTAHETRRARRQALRAFLHLRARLDAAGARRSTP